MGQGVFRKLPSGNEEWGRGIPTNPNLHKFGEQDEEAIGPERGTGYATRDLESSADPRHGRERGKEWKQLKNCET